MDITLGYVRFSQDDGVTWTPSNLSPQATPDCGYVIYNLQLPYGQYAIQIQVTSGAIGITNLGHATPSTFEFDSPSSAHSVDQQILDVRRSSMGIHLRHLRRCNR